MEKLIYYPYFNIREEKWLKFALLYIGEIKLILPHSAIKFIDPTINEIMQETNLISTMTPEMNIGHHATLDAIDWVEKILRNPNRYNLTLGNGFIQSWRDKKEQTHELFQEKYVYDWECFCIESGLGLQSENGLLVSQDVANIFMSFLAHSISEDTGTEVITNEKNYDRLMIQMREVPLKTVNKLDIAESILRIQMPANIDDLDFKTLIKFRNRNGFNKKLKAFHSELNIMYERFEDGNFAEDFISQYLGYYNELIGDFNILASVFANVGLMAWTIYDVGYSDINVDLANIGFSLGTICSVNQKWKGTEQKRFCRKYLTDLELFPEI